MNRLIGLPFLKPSIFTYCEILFTALLYASAASRVELAEGKSRQISALQNTAYYNEGYSAYPYDGLKYGKYEDTTDTYKAIDEANGKTFKLASNSVKSKVKNLKKGIESFKLIVIDIYLISSIDEEFFRLSRYLIKL